MVHNKGVLLITFYDSTFLQQAFAAKEQSDPLEDWQVDSIRDSIAALPNMFPEERVRNMAGAVSTLL